MKLCVITFANYFIGSILSLNKLKNLNKMSYNKNGLHEKISGRFEAIFLKTDQKLSKNL